MQILPPDPLCRSGSSPDFSRTGCYRPWHLGRGSRVLKKIHNNSQSRDFLCTGPQLKRPSFVTICSNSHFLRRVLVWLVLAIHIKSRRFVSISWLVAAFPQIGLDTFSCKIFQNVRALSRQLPTLPFRPVWEFRRRILTSWQGSAGLAIVFFTKF